MSTEPLRYWVEVAGRLLETRSVTGFEALSRPYRFEVELTLPRGVEPPDPDQVVGTQASLRLTREGQVRDVDGLVTDFSVSATARGAPEVRLVIEPRFALTRLRRDIRIFRDKTVPEIVVEVLAGHGIVPELRLGGAYASRPYCVELRESDHDFVNRLLEDEGIFYFFLEDDLLVLGDSPAAYEASAGAALPFRPGSGLDGNDDAVLEVGRRARLSAGRVTLRDFNPAHPDLDMDVSAAAYSPDGPELYDFPGEYEAPPAGARKAKLWGESIACAAAAFTGVSSSGRLLPAGTFALADAPPGVAAGQYVVTRVEHAWHRTEEVFSVRFEALPAATAYRPPRITRAPTIVNPVTAVVTGPPGQDDIYTDSVGRVKVHFHWDRRLPYDDTCSHWVPMLQDNTGESMSIPRIGWEVLVHFLEGDPDRPVVLGRVFNAADRYHQPLPDNKTQSMIKSLSSPREPLRDESGTNEILFEDLAGREYIQIYAQKDQTILVGNDKREEVVLTETSIVKRDESITIGESVKNEVAQNVVLTTNGEQTITVGADHTRKVTGTDTASIGGDHTLTIGGMHSRRIGMNDVTTAHVLTEKVGGIVLEASLKGNLTSANKTGTLVVGGAVVEIASKDKSETAGLLRTETIGGLVFVRASKNIETRSNQKRATTVGAALTVSADKELLLAARKEVAMTAPVDTFTGDKEVTFKVGATTLVLKDGTIAITTGSQIKLTVSGTNNQGAGKSTQI